VTTRPEATDTAALRLAYSALPPIPEWPGERMWFDRMRTYDAFLADAPRFVAWVSAQHAEGSTEPRRTRRHCPALFDLCFEACGVPRPT
jgi:hypothetical protein